VKVKNLLRHIAIAFVQKLLTTQVGSFQCISRRAGNSCTHSTRCRSNHNTFRGIVRDILTSLVTDSVGRSNNNRQDTESIL